MSFWEEIWLTDCPPEFKPLLYRRYVDDTFVIFNDPGHVNLFLDFLNSRHPNIKFTCENEVNGMLPFLDVSITRGINGFFTNLYRKATFTGLFSSFSSFTDVKFKRGLVYGLVHRAFKICSSQCSFNKELSKIKYFLSCNLYPKFFVENVIKYYFKKFYGTSAQVVNVNDNNHIFIQLPFLGDKSYQIKNKLLNFLCKAYPEARFLIVFKPHFRV